MTARLSARWPSAPYKGLSYYGPEDAPLFAGREDDVWQCARLIEHSSTRLLILHGLTGCGKSSFLRAGLIPILEDPAAGFHFMKADQGSEAKALFIRCTDRPLEALSESLLVFINAGLELQTPLGRQVVNLQKALPPVARLDVLAARTDVPAVVDVNPETLEGILSRLSNIVPQTLTLVIDQAEEVLTLDQSGEGQESRDAFFQFLALFSRSTYDLKLVIALRTEYYGRFYSRARAALADVLGIREYFLDELRPDQLKQAILRPTLDDPSHPEQSPRRFYKFAYDETLPDRVIKDLSESVVAGGILPVLQLVCSTLYERTKPPIGKGNGEWVITTADYEALGGPQGQVEEHLESVLHERARSSMPVGAALGEMDRWKDVLHRLVRVQADGSVTTDITKETELLARIANKRCKLDGSSTLAYLARDEVRILREVFVLDRATRYNVRCYSLGHDTLGLVLRRWKVAQEEILAGMRRAATRGTIVGVGLLSMVCVVAGFQLALQQDFVRWEVLVGTGLYFVGLTAVARYMPRFLHRRVSVPFRFFLMIYVRLFPNTAHRLLKDPAFKRLWQTYPDIRDRLLARQPALRGFWWDRAATTLSGAASRRVRGTSSD